MPQLEAPQQPREVDLELAPYMTGAQEPDDAAAVKLVKTTFGRYESMRLTHERRWDTAARLYHGTIDERNWPGTDVKRAALPVPIVFDQVESSYPIIMDAVFNYWPTFFDVTPGPGTSMQECLQVRDVMSAYLETPPDETGITPIVQMGMAIHQSQKYSDGAVELSWDMKKKIPRVDWVDTRDLYFDPTTPGPVVDWSPAVIQRALMTVEDLKALHGTTGVKIPSDEVLNYLAKARYVTTGDMTRQREAMARREVFYVGDLRTDPKHQVIEVLKYWTKDRLIWVLGRLWAAINQPNPYGFIPYARCPWVVIEGRPYSIGLPDVLEGDQKYAQGIRNARIDNLSLAMNPPRTRAQGTPSSPSSTAWRPGLEDRVSDPKQVEVAKIENYTPQAMEEEQAIYQSAQKRTGINDMVQSGVPTPSNANRSATGVSSQQRAVSTRLSTQVSNIENFMIVPLLYKMKALIEKFAPEQFEVSVPQRTGPDGKPVPAHTVATSKSLFSKQYSFRMEAASRMMTKDRLAQFIGPVAQMLFNPSVMSQANVQGQTLDFNEWSRFFQDATGTSRSYQFFRAMSPDEQQQAQQANPAMMQMQTKMQLAQQENQTRLQIAQGKQQVEHERNVLSHHAATNESGEKSARELLKLLSDERLGRLQGLLQQQTNAQSNDGGEESDRGSED